MDEPIADSKPYATFVFNHEGEQYILRSDYERLREMLRWIPVSERLPAIGQDVAAVTRSGRRVVVCRTTLYSRHCWIEYGDEVDVTYWMPLPPAPPEAK